MDDRTKKAHFAHKVFLALSSSTDSRLMTGLMARQKMREQLDRGESPTGYRAEWLKTTAKRVIVGLAAAAKEFNAEYTNDMISIHDLADVLSTALAMLHRAADEEAPEEEPNQD